MRVNFHHTLLLTERCLTMLDRSDAPTIVSVASMAGRSAWKRLGHTLREPVDEKDAQGTLTLDGVRAFIASFENSVAAGTHRQDGWPNSNYGVSKLGLIMAMSVLARDLRGRRFRVNSCCPGYCATDMSSHGGTRSASDGARNAVMCALPSGCGGGGGGGGYGGGANGGDAKGADEMGGKMGGGFTGKFVENGVPGDWPPAGC